MEYLHLVHNYSATLSQEYMCYRLAKHHIVSHNDVQKSMQFCQSLVVWYGLIFIRSGVYQGAIYKFTLTVSKGYPDDGCPVRLWAIYVATLLHQYCFFTAGV